MDDRYLCKADMTCMKTARGVGKTCGALRVSISAVEVRRTVLLTTLLLTTASASVNCTTTLGSPRNPILSYPGGQIRHVGPHFAPRFLLPVGNGELIPILVPGEDAEVPCSKKRAGAVQCRSQDRGVVVRIVGNGLRFGSARLRSLAWF